MRRLSSALATVAVAAVALTGCAAGSSDAESSTDSTAAATSEGQFPATVETKFGEVTVDAKPERIVALGWGDAETVLALGDQPIGASDWLAFGEDVHGVGPWAEQQYDQDTDVTILKTYDLDYESVAALQPDLILDTKGSGDADRYEKLSSIATTIGVPEGGDNYLTSSEEQLSMISTALGEPTKGQELQAEIDAKFDEVKAAHPDWAGKTVTVATKTSEGWGAYIDGDTRLAFMQDLGFTQNPTIEALPAGESGFSVTIAQEELDQLDADLVVAFPIYIDTAEITNDAQWQAVPAVAAGHSVVVDGDLSAAFSIGTPQALLYALDELPTKVTDAIGG